MAFYYGSHTITGLHYGSHPITALYKGSTLIWSPGGIRDPFDTDGTLNPALWAQEGTGYDIGVENGLCRVLMSDNVPLISEQNRRARYTAAQHLADGYVEIVVGNPGSGSRATDVFRRATNTTGGAAGVGIRLRSSDLSIVRRVSSTDTEMRQCGAFQAGDRIRLTQLGNLHTMQRNGQFVGEWDDTGATALNTSSERTLQITMRGYKEVFGPRRFSPSLDSVECV